MGAEGSRICSGVSDKEAEEYRVAKQQLLEAKSKLEQLEREKQEASDALKEFEAMKVNRQFVMLVNMIVTLQYANTNHYYHYRVISPLRCTNNLKGRFVH
jgi:uncharacterized protein (UPF0335 family)